MRKHFLGSVVLLLLITSAADASATRTVGQSDGGEIGPPTLQKGLDDAGKTLIELWLKNGDGLKVRMWCDFQCTQWCDEQRLACKREGHVPKSECQAQWEACLCINQCCTNGCP